MVLKQWLSVAAKWEQEVKESVAAEESNDGDIVFPTMVASNFEEWIKDLVSSRRLVSQL